VLSGFYGALRAIIKASKDSKTIKQGTAGNRKRDTSTIPQKLEINTRRESWNVVII